MPVNTTHEDYDRLSPLWQKCRDCYGGEDEVKAQGELYLPKLGGQESDEYAAYKLRASFYNATKRTVEGILGAIFRKDVHIEGAENEAISGITTNTTNTGISLNALAKAICREEQIAGRCGMLIDIPDQDDKAPGARLPFATLYRAENILNWKAQYFGGVKTLVMVVLKESYLDDKDDFEVSRGDQYRVLRLVEGRYVVEIYREKDDKISKYDEKTPLMRGEPLPYIPFMFFGIESNDSDPETPPLLDLVNVNLSHYRSSADLEHGRHWTALPTAWAAGFDITAEMQIGSQTAWVAADPQARCGYLEFTGAGLAAIEKALDQKQAQMATLGARLLEEPRDTNESGVAIRLRLSGESGVIQSMSRAVSDGLTKALRWMAAWSGIVPDSIIEKLTVTLNQQLFEEDLDPQQLTAVVAAWQGSAISHETAYYNMQKMGVARPGVTFEEEKLSIDAGTDNENM